MGSGCGEEVGEEEVPLTGVLIRHVPVLVNLSRSYSIYTAQWVVQSKHFQNIKTLPLGHDKNICAANNEEDNYYHELVNNNNNQISGQLINKKLINND